MRALIFIALIGILIDLQTVAWAGTCPLAEPLNGDTQRKLFRGTLSSSEVVGTIERGESIDPYTSIRTPSTYELLELRFSVEEDYSGVGETFVAHRPGQNTAEILNSSTISVCNGCAPDYEEGESYFIVAEPWETMMEPMPCGGGYSEGKVRHWAQTGEDTHDLSQRVCGAYLAGFITIDDPAHVDRLNDKSCRIELEALLNSGGLWDSKGVADYMLELTLRANLCELRARAVQRQDTRPCMSLNSNTERYETCFRDANARFETNLSNCKTEDTP